MASNYTSSYNLCQWEPDDPVRRTEFNEDNAKIDAAIKAVDSRVDSVSGSKASQSALDSLKNMVSSLSATAANLGNTLTKKGNCEISVSSYVGIAERSRTHSFGRKPQMLLILGDTLLIAVQGCPTALLHTTGSTYSAKLTWSGNNVTISGKDSNSVVVNSINQTYYMVAFFDMYA